VFHIYNVGYGTCEESEYIQWIHESKFTDKQLGDIVEEVIVAVLAKKADPKSQYKHVRSPTFQHIMDDAEFEKEMYTRGFRKLEFEARFDVFGWSSALDQEDWKSHVDTEQRLLVGRLRKKLLKLKPKYEKELKIGEAAEKQRKSR